MRLDMIQYRGTYSLCKGSRLGADVDAERSPADWQLRLVAGAVGAATSAVAAVVIGLTGIGLVMGVVGTPVGALLGLGYAPAFMADGDSSGVEDVVVGLAILIGTVAVSLVLA